MSFSPDPQEADEAPPVLGSWSNLYVFVLIVHLVLLTSFYLASLRYA